MTPKRKQLILMVLLAVVLAGFFAYLVQTRPLISFQNKVYGGIGLLRDDHEFVEVYYDRVSYVFDHAIPYKHNRLEYPPLGILYISIPAFFLKTIFSYRLGLLILNGITAVILVVFILYLLDFLGHKRKIIWLLLLPSFIYFVYSRFDVLPATLMLLSLWLLIRKKFSWSFFILSLLFLTKGFAIVLFPVYFLYYLNELKLGEISLIKNKPILLFAVPVIIVIVAVCVLAGFSNGLFPYAFQSTRFFGYGSLWSLYFPAWRSFLPPNIFNPAASLAAKAFAFLQILLPLVLFCGHQTFRKYIKTPADAIRWSLLALLVYIQFSVYYSPQWFLWILPLFVLLRPSKRLIVLVITYDIINYLQFPVSWYYLGPPSLGFGILVLARSIIMICMMVLLVQSIVSDYRLQTRQQ